MAENTEPREGFSLSRWSVSSATIIIILTLAATIAGFFAFFSMSRREEPEIKVSVALVISIYPGASAEKVEEQVTKKLEARIEGMDTLKKMTSTSRPNLSVVMVAVDYDTDTNIEWQKLRSRIAEAKSELPSTLIGPSVMDTFGDTTGMIIALTGKTPLEMRPVARDLTAKIRHLSSVGSVTILGEPEEAVYLEAKSSEMAKYGFTPYQVAQMMQMHNVRIPAGMVRTNTFEYLLEPSGEFRSIEDIKNTIIDVSKTTGQPVHIRDLFEVKREPKNPQLTEFYRTGEDAIFLGIIMKKGKNIVQMGNDIRKLLDNYPLPDGIQMEIVHDSPRQVDEQINAFSINLLEGIIIVIIIMTLFMGWRAASVSAVAIPVSVICTMAFMPMLNIDLEVVSIASFIVVLGMLVDNSIVITDVIDVNLRNNMPIRDAVWKGSGTITRPLIVGTLASVVAFLPMLLLTKEIGAYVRSLPLVVSLSLILSLVVSQTITPVMAKQVMRASKKPKKKIEDKIFARAYRKMMHFCLHQRILITIFTIVVLLGAVLAVKSIGLSFFPDAQRDQFTVDIWLKDGSSVVESSRIAKEVEAELLADPDVKSTAVYAGVGGPRFYITVMPVFQTQNYAQLMVNTQNQRVTAGVIERFNEKAKERWPGARVYAKKIVMGIPVNAPIEFRISGDNLKDLRAVSTEIQDILRKTDGCIQIQDDTGDDIPSLRLDIDTERANRVGVTNTDVALSLLSSYEGFELTRYHDGDEEIPIILRLAASERSIQNDIYDLPVASTITSEKVPLSSIASIEPQWNAAIIHHYTGTRAISVQAWTDGRLTDDIVREVWPKIQALSIPNGVSVSISGEKASMDEAFGELAVVFAIIVIAILLLLLFQLKTLRRTFVVMISIPLAAAGAAYGLFIGGYTFSFTAFLGVISLAGMAIKNCVMWIEYVEDARAAGDEMEEAIIHAGIYRFRPIMLTAATTVGGLLPLYLFGGVLFEPMACGMIMGLSLVTVFTLVNIPVFYKMIAK